MNKELSGYDLSRKWFDFSFENPELITPTHAALYFFTIEHCNRLGWKKKFGLPTTMAMEAIGIKSYNTYKKVFADLVKFGFINVVEKSKNQYSSNIVALLKYDRALDKALDKALIKHSTKQSESTIQSTVQSIDSIDKQLTIEQRTSEQEESIPAEIKFSITRCLEVAMKDPKWVKENKPTQVETTEFLTMLTGTGEHEKNPADFKRHFYHWKKKGKLINPSPSDAKLDIQTIIEQENARKLRELHEQD